ncbi:MAG: hypothetical protein AAF617_00165 [Bacteroidota bacterium]
MEISYFKTTRSILTTLAAVITISGFIVGIYQSGKYNGTLQQKNNTEETLVEKTSTQKDSIQDEGKKDTIPKNTQEEIVAEQPRTDRPTTNEVRPVRVTEQDDYFNIRRMPQNKDRQYSFNENSINYNYIEGDSIKNEKLKKKMKIDQ